MKFTSPNLATSFKESQKKVRIDKIIYLFIYLFTKLPSIIGKKNVKIGLVDAEIFFGRFKK